MPIQPTSPPAEQGNPFLPNSQEPCIFEDFQGINTSTSRYGVDDKMMAWCDGWFPIGPKQLRTIPGIGPALYTETGVKTVVFFDFYNIGPIPYMVVFSSDGSVDQVTAPGGVVTTILPAGSILTPTRNTIDTTQWGSEYLVIVASQTDGYFLWDGSTLFEAGTLGPVVTITNPGSGYQTPPSVTARGGAGTGATFVAAIANGVVTGVTISNPGSGYSANDTVTLLFVGGTSAGTGGVLTAVMGTASGSGAVITCTLVLVGVQFSVNSVTIVNGGSGYSPFTTILVTGGGNGAGGERGAQLTPTIVAGVITAVAITNAGLYNTNNPPTLSANDGGTFFVTSVTVNNGGSGYSPSAVATASGGDPPVGAQATLSLIIVNGVITSVDVTNAGIYSTATAPSIAVTDTVVNAAGTVTLMPFAVQGNAVETFQQRVWVADQATLYWTAPGSFNDFATSNGGGNLTSSDSFLRVTYVRLRQTNGFLYLIGDSSVNYISGVQTSGSPPTTTFNNQNADPEVGTPYPASVTVFGRNIVFANAFGVQVSYGAAVTKISEALDGVWNSVANFGGFNISAAKAIIFAKKVWMVLVPIVDPVSGLQVNKLFIWNGKLWFSTPQDVALTYIQHQEINSVLTAYGSDGTKIYPLFAQASTAFTKTVQSRLWASPGGYQFVKAAARLWMLLSGPDASPIQVSVSVDSERGQANNFQTYTIASPTPIFTLQNNAVGQIGVLTGLTIKTTQGDISLWTAMLQHQVADGLY